MNLMPVYLVKFHLSTPLITFLLAVGAIMNIQDNVFTLDHQPANSIVTQIDTSSLT